MTSSGVAIEMKPGDLQKLERRLAKLSVRSGRKVLRKGTRAASAVIMKAVRKNTPVGPTGNLKKSIGRRFKFYRKNYTDIAVVGPRIDAPKGQLGYHGHLVEFGTDERFTKAHDYRGAMPARPFVEPAALSVMQVAGENGLAKIKAALEQEIKRVAHG